MILIVLINTLYNSFLISTHEHSQASSHFAQIRLS